MFGSTILEIAVGLAFIYLVLSLICTSLNEYIAQLLSLRAEVLYSAIHSMFAGKDAFRMAEDIYDHAVVQSLREKHRTTDDPVRKKPSYIPASPFSIAVTDLIGLKEPIGLEKALHPQLFSDVVDETKALYESGVIDPLKPLIHAANGNLDQARKNVEKWYDDAMQRATGWYKRKIQVITVGVALVIAIVLNADTLMIVDRLWANPVQRTQIEAAAKNLNAGTLPESASQLQTATRDAALGMLGWQPVGTKNDPRSIPSGAGWIRKVLGLLITVCAAMLGAPFWFDMLGKVMNIRSAGKSPTEKPTSGGPPPAEKNRVHSSDSVAVGDPEPPSDQPSTKEEKRV